MKSFHFATLLIILSGITLPAWASIEDATIGYEIFSVSRPSETEISTFTVEWAGLDTSLWGAYVNADYRPDEYDNTKVIYKLDVYRNGIKCGQCQAGEDATTNYSVFPYHYIQDFCMVSPITKPGHYTIEVPRALISNMMSSVYATFINDATTITFDIEGEGKDDNDEENPKPVIPEGKMELVGSTPDFNDLPDSISEIVWRWDTAHNEDCYWHGSETLDIYNIDHELYATAKVSNRDYEDGEGNSRNEIHLDLNLPIEISGHYYLTVPANVIANNVDKSAATIFNELTSLEYCVLAPTGRNPTIIYPDSDTSLSYVSGETLATISVNYENSVEIDDTKLPFLYTDDGAKIYADAIRSFTLETQGALLIDFNDAANLPTGKYLLVVPRGCVVGGEGVRINYYYVGKPAEIVKEEPIALSKATVAINTGVSYDLLNSDNGVDYIPDNSLMLLSTNYDDVCDTYYFRILDVTYIGEDGDVETGDPVIANFAYKENGFTAPIFCPRGIPFKFASDHTYIIAVECYSNYHNSLRKEEGMLYGPRFSGSAPAYQYSDANLLKVTPAPGSEYTASTVITMTFDQPVEFIDELSGIPMGQAGKESIAGYESLNGGKEWQFTLPSSTLENFSGPNSINVRFTFNDMNGHRVRPSNLNVPESDQVTPIRNMGSEDTSNICVWYGTYAGCSPFYVVPAPGSTVEALSHFEYHCNGGELNPSWLGHQVNVLDSEGYVVASFICDDAEEFGGNVKLTQTGTEEDPMTVRIGLHLDKAVTVPGTYTISYPYAYFAMGREQAGTNSVPVTHTYYVANSGIVGAEAIECESTIGVEYYNLQGQKVTNPLKGNLLIKLQGGNSTKIVY